MLSRAIMSELKRALPLCHALLVGELLNCEQEAVSNENAISIYSLCTLDIQFDDRYL